jgi:hypothetical protein
LTDNCHAEKVRENPYSMANVSRNKVSVSACYQAFIS